MKKFLLIAAIVAGFYAVPVFAADPVAIVPGLPESNYAVTQSSVAVSSNTTTTDAAVSGYRSTCIGNTSTGSTVYYRIDGSTQNVAVVGYPIFPLTNHCVEYNGKIGWQLGAGTVASIDARKKVIRK
jgi:hypothetical protein